MKLEKARPDRQKKQGELIENIDIDGENYVFSASRGAITRSKQLEKQS